MSVELQVLSLFIIIIYYVWIFYLLRKKRFSIKNSLLWLLGGMVMLAIIVFPETIRKLAPVFGVEVPSNGLFAVSIFFIVLISIYLTAVISEVGEKTKTLTQKIGLLEKRIRELEEIISEKQKRRSEDKGNGV